MKKIGFGGSCHWCTEAIFSSLMGVQQVEQGWIASVENAIFSEAVIVNYDPATISLQTLIEIHLRTHSATSNHTMRQKYRSAIYAFIQEDYDSSSEILNELQSQFSAPLITEVERFQSFKLNEEKYLDYYYKNPQKPFCKNVIDPKLSELRRRFQRYVK